MPDRLVSSDSETDAFRISVLSSCKIDLGSSSIREARPKDIVCPNLDDTGLFEAICEAC